MKIAIIGAGVAGANVLRTILKHKNLKEEDCLAIFEKREQLGVGLPYEQDSPVKRLNIPHDEITLDPNNPNDFSQWLEENVEEPFNFEGLVSRVDCGHYIEDRMGEYFNHPKVAVKHEEVVRLDYLDEKTAFLLETESEHQEEFDVVFICIGHPMYNDFYHLEGTENYIHNPYPMKQRLANISEEKQVGILGTGPTGIDIYRYLVQEKQLAKPPVFLNHGDFLNLSGISWQGEEIALSLTWDWIKEKAKGSSTGLIPLQDIFDRITRDFDQEGVDLQKVYLRAKDLSLANQKKLIEDEDQEVAFLVKYFEELVEFYPTLYGLLSGSDRLLLKEKYEDFLDLFRSFNPPGTNRWLIQEIEAGRGQLLHELEDIKSKGDGFTVIGTEQVELDVLVNATGFDSNLVHNISVNPLLKSLFDQNIILPDEQGEGILVNWPRCQVMNKKYGVMETLYVQGMWIAPSHYRNNDIRSILQVSEMVADEFMNSRGV